MGAQWLDGRPVAAKMKADLSERIRRSGVTPGIAFLTFEGDDAARHYAAAIKKACREAGIFFFNEAFPSGIGSGDFIASIRRLNDRPEIHGILIQSPLPPGLDAGQIAEAVAIEKDVDGIHPHNRGLLFAGRPRFVPCTPRGVIALLEESGIALAGKRVVVLGRSATVGRPLAMLFLQRDATVTICHRKTANLGGIAREGEILVAAVGSPGFVGEGWVARGAVVVDVGINTVGGKIVGDVDFDPVSRIASHITPVPGGVGPMTVAALLENTFAACVNVKSFAPPADSKKEVD